MNRLVSCDKPKTTADSEQGNQGIKDALFGDLAGSAFEREAVLRRLATVQSPYLPGNS
jgi:hypothetical protein